MDENSKKTINVEALFADGTHIGTVAMSMIRRRHYSMNMIRGVHPQEVIDYLQYPEGHPKREAARYVRGIDLKQYDRSHLHKP